MDKLLVVVKPLVKVLKGDIAEIVKVVKGSEFVGKEYETCFPWLCLLYTSVTFDGLMVSGGGMFRSNYGEEGYITINYKNILVAEYNAGNNGPFLSLIHI